MESILRFMSRLAEPKNINASPAILVMAHLHFIYSQHAWTDTGIPLERKIKELRKRGITPAFIARESAGLKARDRVSFEARMAPAKNAQYIIEAVELRDLSSGKILAMPRTVEEAGKNIERNFYGLTSDRLAKHVHDTCLEWLALQNDIPLVSAEAAKIKQSKKLSRMNTRLDTSEDMTEKRLPFNEALIAQKRQFYEYIAYNKARHDEVPKSLKTQLKRYGPDAYGIVVFGAHHVGLHEQVARELGVETTFEQEHPGYSDTWPVFQEMASKSYADPKFKPTEEDFARMILEMKAYKLEPFQSEEIGRAEVHEDYIKIMTAIRGISLEQVRSHWQEFLGARNKVEFLKTAVKANATKMN